MSNAALRLPARLRRPRRVAPLTAVAAGLLILLVGLSLFAPLLTSQDPTSTDLSSLYLSPSSQHWLGTDSNGRDLLARLLWGGRTALLGPLVVSALAAFLGSAMALLAAWRGGWMDAVVSRGFDLLFSFPGLLLAILAAATFGKGLTAAAIALAISYTPYMGRIVRSAAAREVVLPYVTALRASGFSGVRVVIRHVLPNLRSLVLAQGAVLFSYAMVDLAAISFLGLGVQQPTPDWGAMTAEGLTGMLSGKPQEAIFAGALIVLVVVCVNLLGERLGSAEVQR